MKITLVRYLPTLLLVGACSSGVGVDESEPAAANSGALGGVRVSITPSKVIVPPGGRTRLVVAVNGIASQAVSWDTDGGWVDVENKSVLYTAPNNAGGTHHVTATSTVDRTVSATATILVSDSPGQGLAIFPNLMNTTPDLLIGYDASQTFTAFSDDFVGVSTGASVSANAVPDVQWSLLNDFTGVSNSAGMSAGSVDASGNYAAPANTGVFHIVATDPTEPARTSVAEIEVTYGYAPTLKIEPAVTRVSPQQQIQFSVTSSDGSNSFAWSAARGNITQYGYYMAPSQAGVYLVSVSNTNSYPSASAFATVIVH